MPGRTFAETVRGTFEVRRKLTIVVLHGSPSLLIVVVVMAPFISGFQPLTSRMRARSRTSNENERLADHPAMRCEGPRIEVRDGHHWRPKEKE